MCTRIPKMAHLKCRLVDTVPCNLSLDIQILLELLHVCVMWLRITTLFCYVPILNLKCKDTPSSLLPAMVPSSCRMELVHSVGLPNTTSAFFLNPAKTGVLQSSVPILATTALDREEGSGESGGFSNHQAVHKG